MGLLTDELGLATIASALVGQEAVILARRLPTNYVPPTGHTPTVGTRTAWRPPVGPTFAAWGTPEQRQEWLDAVSPDDPGARTRLEHDLDLMRRRGYDLGLTDDQRSRLLRQLADLPDDPTALREFVASILNDAEPMETSTRGARKTYRVHSITAPVFDPDGIMLMSITIDGFRSPLKKQQLDAYATRLVGAVTELTQTLHGRLPADWPARTETPARRART
jgi:DNA-binding IclR family transcriptional regulator